MAAPRQFHLARFARQLERQPGRTDQNQNRQRQQQPRTGDPQRRQRIEQAKAAMLEEFKSCEDMLRMIKEGA